MKKVQKFLMFFIVSVFLISCSKEAEDAANGTPVGPETINGRWKHSNGDVLEISMTTGLGIYKAGPAPSGAVNGRALSSITYGSGLFWEALSHTYYSSGWSTSYTVIGIVMDEGQNSFKIGSQVYTRQN
jgi:hypothetical protein